MNTTSPEPASPPGPRSAASYLGRAPADSLGLPVAPRLLPFVGHLNALMGSPEATMAATQALGSPLVWTRLFGSGWVIELTRPEGFELLRKKSASVNHYSRIAGEFLGHSLLTRDGEEHRQVRQALNRAFTPKGLTGANVGVIMKALVERHVANMTAADEVIALSATRELALDIIFAILGIDGADLPTWRHQYEEFMGAIFPIKWKIPGSPAWRAARARIWLNTELQGRVNRIRQDDTQQGMMAELVRDWDLQDPPPPDSWLLDNLLIMALAGHETTASTMAWMLAHLASDPALWASLVDEAQSVAEVPATPSDLAKFPVAEALFRESLRLYPPVVRVSRELIEETELLGVTLPAGLQVVVPILVFNRHPDVYSDPLTFSIDRWEGKAGKPSPLETLAFSYGPHFCLGYHVAWIEAVQFAVALALAGGHDGQPRLKGAFPRARWMGLCQPNKADTRMSLGAK